MLGIMKPNNRFRMEFRSQTEVFDLRYSARDSKMLACLPEGEDFLRDVGVWENFKVATGMDTEAWCEKSAARVLASAVALYDRLHEDKELLQYNYTYAFSDSGSGPRDINRFASGRISGFRVGGLVGSISSRYPGHIWAELRRPEDGEVVQKIDLRSAGPLETSWGRVKIRRRKTGTGLHLKLDALIEKLKRVDGLVRIRHCYVNEQDA